MDAGGEPLTSDTLYRKAGGLLVGGVGKCPTFPDRRLRRHFKDRVEVTLATHDPISCFLGQPCLWLHRHANQRNILRVLAHEELHHALNRVTGDDAESKAVDDRWPLLHDVDALFGRRSWQP
jgi:hypothetical protein